MLGSAQLVREVAEPSCVNGPRTEVLQLAYVYVSEHKREKKLS